MGVQRSRGIFEPNWMMLGSRAYTTQPLTPELTIIQFVAAIILKWRYFQEYHDYRKTVLLDLRSLMLEA